MRTNSLALLATSAALAATMATASPGAAEAPPATGPAAYLTVGDATIVEGDGATRVVRVPLSLSTPLGTDVRVTWSTEPLAAPIPGGKGVDVLPAAEGDDYRTVPRGSQPKIARIRAGRTSVALPVRIVDDELDETTEAFQVRIDSVDGDPGAAILREVGVVTVVDDDAVTTTPDGAPSVDPRLAVGRTTTAEGDGNSTVRVAFTLTQPQSTDVLVSWVTEDKTTTAGEDYRPVSRTTRIRAGRTQAFASVRLIGDDLPEGSEGFYVLVTGVSGGDGVTVLEAAGSVTVIDDDDRDGDGLIDLAEVVRYGTDPDQADTDRDGLVDPHELFEFATDPNSADTDGDGWDDLYEVKSGTDPTDPASHPTSASPLGA